VCRGILVCCGRLPGVPRKILKLTLDISRSISKFKCLKKIKIENYTTVLIFFTSVKLIPLSADTIARRIQDMSDDIDRQLVDHFADNQEPFSKLWAIQIDKSTDISNKAQILVYLRMVMNGSIQN
jgi:hypothetical protein